MGSSRARAHVDSKIMEDSLHLSTYNLGLDGFSFNMQYCRYELALKKNRNPKLIVQSLDYGTFENQEELYQIEQFTPYIEDKILTRYSSKYKGFDFWDYHLPLVRYIGKRSQVFYAIKTGMFPALNKNIRYKGFYSNYITWNTDFDIARNKNSHYYQSIDTKLITQFEKYIEDTRHRKIDLIFVFTPVYNEGQKYVSNSGDILLLYKNLSQKFQIPFFDYSNDTMCKNKEYFYNATHLNKKGASLFSEKFAHDLKRLDFHNKFGFSVKK